MATAIVFRAECLARRCMHAWLKAVKGIARETALERIADSLQVRLRLQRGIRSLQRYVRTQAAMRAAMQAGYLRHVRRVQHAVLKSWAALLPQFRLARAKAATMRKSARCNGARKVLHAWALAASDARLERHRKAVAVRLYDVLLARRGVRRWSGFAVRRGLTRERNTRAVTHHRCNVLQLAMRAWCHRSRRAASFRLVCLTIRRSVRLQVVRRAMMKLRANAKCRRRVKDRAAIQRNESMRFALRAWGKGAADGKSSQARAL